MSKITKIICLFIFLLTMCLQFAYATDLTENNEDSTSSLSSDVTTYTVNSSGVTSVSQLSNYSEANLGLNNILSIILIAVGVLIILFAIAILIRLKQ